jgi:CheY-like chemotaxis protein
MVHAAEPPGPRYDRNAMDVGSGMPSLQILLVEDHADSADALARLLRSRGHRVTVAYDKTDALVAAAGLRSIDVLVSDITLPDGNGCDLLRVLRERRAGPPRLAVAVTGHDECHMIEECRSAGYHRFLRKPVAFEELLAAIGPWSAPDTPVSVRAPDAPA